MFAHFLNKANNFFNILQMLCLFKLPIAGQPTISISTALVKKPYEETKAGMMDCEKYLSETGRDLRKARETRG